MNQLPVLVVEMFVTKTIGELCDRRKFICHCLRDFFWLESHLEYRILMGVAAQGLGLPQIFWITSR